MVPHQPPWVRHHEFHSARDARAERRTRAVVALTAVMMLVEAAAGWLTGSMALIADAAHMASHAGALGIAAAAYGFARRHARNARFTFGTGKVTVLAGYTSALALGAAAVWMAVESASRLARPSPIHFGDAIVVAMVGLLVNLASAWMLGDAEHDHHGSATDPADHHHHVDHNLRAAYLHVLADALTSVLAIIALAGGLAFGWAFLDPLMGIVGSLVVGRWAWGLARDTARVLIDAEDHSQIAERVRRVIEAEPGVSIADLHVWRVGPANVACIVAINAASLTSALDWHTRLAHIPGLAHLTVEIHPTPTSVAAVADDSPA